MGSATASTPALPPDPLRLRRRLLLQGGGFALVLLLAFTASLYGGIVRQREEDQRLELRQLAAGAASQLPLILHEARESEGPLKFRGQPGEVRMPGLEQQRLQWFDAAGALLRQQGALAVPAPMLQRSMRWQRWDGGLSLAMPVHRSTATRELSGMDGPLLGFVRVSLSDLRARQDLERLQRGLLLGAVVATLAALLVGRRMLAAAFAPLQRQVEALQRFTADASHELRHPLAAMRVVLAGMPQDLRNHPDLAWRELDALTRRQSELLDDLLLLARLEQGGDKSLATSLRPQHFDLVELLEDLIARTAPLAAERGVRLRLSPSAQSTCLPVRGQAEQLQRLFTNLLLNAVRHSPEHGEVAVEVSAGAQRLRVAVVDAGRGIAPEARERVFERFWRGGDQGGQSGLGLAIARSIARRHGGDLSVGESRPGHCVLVAELPRSGPLS
jgi:signal transduction histidine kinase